MLLGAGEATALLSTKGGGEDNDIFTLSFCFGGGGLLLSSGGGGQWDRVAFTWGKVGCVDTDLVALSWVGVTDQYSSQFKNNYFAKM